MFLRKIIRNLPVSLSLVSKSKRLHIDNKMMKNAYVRFQEDAEQFQVSLQFINLDLGINREFNFSRRLSENVSDFLGRINSSFDKSLSKKKKKKRKPGNEPAAQTEEPPSEVKAELLMNGEAVSGEIICKDVLTGNIGGLSLRILGLEYMIVVNAPWVDIISLPCSIMTEFPVYPSKLEMSFASKEECIFTWYKSKIPDDGASNSKDNELDWIEVGTGYLYTPALSDIGCRLKLACKPVKGTRQGPVLEAVSKNNIEAGPGECPFQQRQVFTPHLLDGKNFRVVSYNILADLYADSEVARTELYPYCPSYALHIDYRKQLLIKEIIGYNADLLCLQEVDSKVFDLDLQPVLQSFGYQGVFHRKGGVNEGLSCIFHASKFVLVESYIKLLAEDLESNPLYADIWRKIEAHEPLKTRLINRNTCVQVTVLDSITNPQERLVVGNIHLYFHPNADHIRLLQAGMAIRFLQTIAMASQCEGRRVTALMCGDFNSTPDCGVYRLMTTRHVSEDCIDWKSTEEEAVKGVSLTHDLNLASACGTPDFTNFTVGFSGCLDYIFYQRDSLDVTQVIPLPSIEEVTLHTALPSVVFPSDHVALVADLRWNSKV